MALCSRREFLQLSGGALVLAAGTGCATIPTHYTELVDDRLSVAVSEFDALAGDHSAIALDAPGLNAPVLLVRTDSGEYRALSSECTHQACRVKPARGFLLCPCHGSTFAFDGSVVRGPAQKPLPTYRATVAGGRIEIRMKETRGET